MAKKEARYNEVPTTEVPEVATYEAVLARYQTFQQNNPEFFQYLRQFEEDLNAARQAADKAVRGLGVTCGSFVFYQKHTKLNVEVAYQLHGHDKFLALGGSVTTVTNKSLDKSRYMSNVQAGVVTQEEREAVVSEEPRYHAPKDLAIT